MTAIYYTGANCAKLLKLKLEVFSVAHRVFEPSFSKLVQVKVQLKFDKLLSIELTRGLPKVYF